MRDDTDDPRTIATGRASGNEPRPPPLGRLPLVGHTIEDRYKVERALGEGGMGVVYLAKDLKFDKKRVAIKVLKDDLSQDQAMVERFFNEAQAASSIGSPHIVSILDYGTAPGVGTAYIVMELIEGRSLASVLDQERILPELRVIRIAKQMAFGLASAHNAGIIHRDLKPDNVQLLSTAATPDFVKILDFGIAKISSRSNLTQAGSVFGTPHYMSPEQSAGLPVDGRGDVYALGVLMYEMVCGRVPFDAETPTAILTQHLYKPPTPPSEVMPPPHRISPGFEAIVLKCLTKRADGRYTSMGALAEELATVEAGQAPAAVAELRARPAEEPPGDYFASSKTAAPTRSTNRAVLFAFMGLAIALLVVLAVASKSSATKGETKSSTSAGASANALPSAQPTPSVPAPSGSAAVSVAPTTLVAPLVSAPPTHASKPPASGVAHVTSVVKPAHAAPPVIDCNPNFRVVDGVKIYKKECPL